MSKMYDAGITTAYGAAVRGGYEGTYEQFCADLGELADVLSEFLGFSVTVETLAEGAEARGEYDAGVLSLGIPRGDTGNGIQSIALNADYTLTVTYTNGQTWTSGSIRGETGATPDLQIGTVSTLSPGSPATAEITGTRDEPRLNLGIPQGVPGEVPAASIAPAYSASSTYAVGEYVMYNNALYRCTTAITTAEAWTAAHWTAAKIGEDLTDCSRQLSDSTTGLDSKAPVILETASGAIASFDDGADSMPIRKIVATIEPVQSGSGDPSPDNVRPISGWTGANIHGTAVNIFGGTLLRDGIDASMPSATVDEDEKTITFGAGAATIQPITTESGLTNRFKENTQYTFLMTFVKASGTVASNLRIYYTDGSYTTIDPLDDASVKQTTVTVSTAGKTVSRLSKSNSSGDTKVYYEESGIFEGVLTADDFVPYTGATLPIAFTDPTTGDPMTVCGGTLTLNADGSVDLVRKYKLKTISASDSIGGNAPNGYMSMSSAGMSSGHHYWDANVKCNIMEKVDGNYSGHPGIRIGAGDKTVYFYRMNEIDATLTTTAAIKAWLIENGCCFTFPLATPQTYHFDNVGQLKTFLVNNVWCDTGDITELTYTADTKLFLIARDEEITGNIAPIENGATASKAYAQGAYFWHDTKFCKALTAIASGATFTLGTNYQETTVAAELLAAQN